MSAVIVRPSTLQHVCKEPLADVQSVHLRGRGITRLVRLDVCPKLTSLDISWNALTELDSACFEGCKELWIVDASHNRLVSAPGYLRWEGVCHYLSIARKAPYYTYIQQYAQWTYPGSLFFFVGCLHGRLQLCTYRAAQPDGV